MRSPLVTTDVDVCVELSLPGNLTLENKGVKADLDGKSLSYVAFEKLLPAEEIEPLIKSRFRASVLK